MFEGKKRFRKPHLWLIRFIGLIVPQRLRADWRQEWEAELRYREAMLAEWDKLNWQNKLDLLWRSTSAFWDALWLQPKRWEDEMFQDLRFGIRMLLRKPGLMVAAVLCLGLGTGANVLIFSLVNAMLLRPVAGLAAPEQLTVIQYRNEQNSFVLISYPDFQDYQKRTHSFSSLLAYRGMMFSLGSDGFTERIQGAIASDNYFSLLGVGTATGRTFRADEEQTPGAYPVAVISHGYWQRRFAADPAIIGKTVMVNTHPFTIIGVAQPDFIGTETGEIFDLWIPLTMQAQVMPEDRLRSRDKHWLLMIGRRKAEVRATQAQQELDILSAQLRQEYPNEHRTITGLHLSPQIGLGPIDYPIVARFLSTVLAVVALVLLIACANVANLLLARAATRRKEIAVRLALGATRARIVRQFLTESLLLAIAGTALGLLIPLLTKDWLLSLFLPLTPEALNFSPDGKVIGFTILLALTTALLFGVVPALQASKPDVVPELKEAAMTGGRRQGRLSNVFVIAQIAITMALLIGAGLLLRTMQRFTAIDPGFATDNVLALSLDLKFLSLPKSLHETGVVN